MQKKEYFLAFSLHTDCTQDLALGYSLQLLLYQIYCV